MFSGNSERIFADKRLDSNTFRVILKLTTIQKIASKGFPMAKADARQTGRAAIWRRMQLACAASLCLAAPAALSQTASSVTPESFQPQLQDLGGSVVFSGNTGTQAPPGSDQIGITLSGVTLEGAFPQMAAANAGFEQRLTRGRIPVSELFEASSELEAAYALSLIHI